MATIENLKRELCELSASLESAKTAYCNKAQELAEAIAEPLGLTVGCIVVQTKMVGYGSTRKQQIRRYKVTRVMLKSYGDPPLEVFGISLRKDGAEGDKHEIDGDWKVES